MTSPSPFYAKGDPGAPVDAVTQVDRTMTFYVQGHAIGTVTMPPYNPIIYHGSDPTVSRLLGVGSTIMWVGTVQPNNALNGDIWADVSGEKPTIITTTLNGMNLGAPFNQTLQADGDQPIQWGMISGSGVLPAGIQLSQDGNLSGTPTSATSYSFDITASNGFGVSDPQHYTVTVGAGIPPTILTTTLDPIQQGSPYTKVMTASGSTGITWTYTGTLPAGLNLVGDTISGTPSTVAAYGPIVFTAHNAYGDSPTHSYSGNVVGVPPTIVTTSLGTLWRGIALSNTTVYPSGLTINVTGSPTISFSKTGSEPAGLTFNTTTGAITGTPSTAGSYTSNNFTVTAHNAYTPDAVHTYSGSVTESTPTILETSLGTMQVGTPFDQTLNLSAGGPPSAIVWSLSGFPAGSPAFAINATTGRITGTPTTAGLYGSGGTTTVTATNTITGLSDTNSYSDTVHGIPVPTIVATGSGGTGAILYPGGNFGTHTGTTGNTVDLLIRQGNFTAINYGSKAMSMIFNSSGIQLWRVTSISGGTVNLSCSVGAAAGFSCQTIEYAAGTTASTPTVTANASSASPSSGAITLSSGQRGVCLIAFEASGGSVNISSPTGGNGSPNPLWLANEGSGYRGGCLLTSDVSTTFGASLSGAADWKTLTYLLS